MADADDLDRSESPGVDAVLLEPSLGEGAAHRGIPIGGCGSLSALDWPWAYSSSVFRWSLHRSASRGPPGRAGVQSGCWRLCFCGVFGVGGAGSSSEVIRERCPSCGRAACSCRLLSAPVEPTTRRRDHLDDHRTETLEDALAWLVRTYGTATASALLDIPTTEFRPYADDTRAVPTAVAGRPLPRTRDRPVRRRLRPRGPASLVPTAPRRARWSHTARGPRRSPDRPPKRSWPWRGASMHDRRPGACARSGLTRSWPLASRRSRRS